MTLSGQACLLAHLSGATVFQVMSCQALGLATVPLGKGRVGSLLCPDCQATCSGVLGLKRF